MLQNILSPDKLFSSTRYLFSQSNDMLLERTFFNPIGSFFHDFF